jgi:hypothetical protein
MDFFLEEFKSKTATNFSPQRFRGTVTKIENSKL